MRPNETIYGLIPYKEGYVNEAYTFFRDFGKFFHDLWKDFGFRLTNNML